jgi:uncharacterized DUF497 family protein
MTIKLTNHAKTKISQRSIELEDIRNVALNPDLIETDKHDKSLIHFIGKIGGRFLRIIGRMESEEELLIISAFFDRRLMRK